MRLRDLPAEHRERFGFGKGRLYGPPIVFVGPDEPDETQDGVHSWAYDDWLALNRMNKGWNEFE